MQKVFKNIRLENLEVPAQYLKSLTADRDMPVILLTGEMGAGKTTFTSSFVNLFTREEYVNSPTFNLYNVYKTPETEIYHFDLYRLHDPGELENLELDEILGKKGISIIEWWQIAGEYLPDKCIEVEINVVDPEFRDIIISDGSEK